MSLLITATLVIDIVDIMTFDALFIIAAVLVTIIIVVIVVVVAINIVVMQIFTFLLD